MTGNHHEKYIRINMDWPNKAGHLRQVLATQKRLLAKLGNRQDKDVQALMISVGEGYDTATDLLQWMETTLKEVGLDAAALAPGSKVRTELDWNTKLMLEYRERHNMKIEQWLDGVKTRMGIKTIPI